MLALSARSKTTFLTLIPSTHVSPISEAQIPRLLDENFASPVSDNTKTGLFPCDDVLSNPTTWISMTFMADKVPKDNVKSLIYNL